MKTDDWLLEVLVCPVCRSPLRAEADAEELACTSETCGLAYPVQHEIVVLLPDEARKP